jgi:hypothetical protein
VVVVLENHSYSEIIGNPLAPFINSLGKLGALFTRSYAITHPSQPNYIALFSGSTQGVTSDSCPHTFAAPSLGSELRAARFSFAGYSEGLPARGYTGCSSGQYARKHSPWVNFSDLPASVNLPLTEMPANPAKLPTVSFVIPNLDHDMHDGTVGQADAWLGKHLGPYVIWASQHRSLLVLTFDEDDSSEDNQIPTIIVGGGVRPGRYDERIDHYRVLRTLEAAYGVTPLAASARTRPITDIWQAD